MHGRQISALRLFTRPYIPGSSGCRRRRRWWRWWWWTRQALSANLTSTTWATFSVLFSFSTFFFFLTQHVVTACSAMSSLKAIHDCKAIQGIQVCVGAFINIKYELCKSALTINYNHRWNPNLSSASTARKKSHMYLGNPLRYCFCMLSTQICIWPHNKKVT